MRHYFDSHFLTDSLVPMCNRLHIARTTKDRFLTQTQCSFQRMDTINQ